MRWTSRNLDTIGTATLTHLGLVAASLALALCVALPLGLLVARRPGLRAAVLGSASVLYSLPTLALFALLVPVLGLGFAPALLALVTYAVPILLRALVAGLASAPPAVLDAADGMGLDAAAAAVAGGIAAGAAGAAGRVAGGLRHPRLGGDGGGLYQRRGPGDADPERAGQGHTEKILVGAGLVTVMALLLDQALGAVQRRLPAVA